MRVMGLDPGLRNMGWGVIEAEGNRLRHVANGVVRSDPGKPVAERLLELHIGIAKIMETNKNPASTLKLGMARGIALFTPASRDVEVGEYLPMIVKKAVVGTGHADKHQVETMVRRLLPGCEISASDAADALAVAICHAHHLATAGSWSAAGAKRALVS